MTVNHGVLGSSPCSGAFWEFSSAGSEHLPYKQRVGGSNPSTPTNEKSLEETSIISKSFFVSGSRSNLFEKGLSEIKNRLYHRARFYVF